MARPFHWTTSRSLGTLVLLVLLFCKGSFDSAEPVVLPIDFRGGWNGFSVPVSMTGVELLGDNLLGAVWTMDDGVYRIVDLESEGLQPGLGYFVYMRDASNLTYQIVPDQIVPQLTSAYDSGWQFIGVRSPVQLPSIAVGSVWYIDDERFQIAHFLEPGVAYFLRLEGPGSLYLGSLNQDDDGSGVADYFEALWERSSQTPASVPLTASERFTLLDDQGVPLSGENIETVTADGQLPPFEFRPAGTSSTDAGGLFVRFPQGATLSSQSDDGDASLNFVEAEVGFSPTAPITFATESGTLQLAVARENGSLPVGPLDAQALANAFDIDPEEGIPVRFFDRFELNWIGGTLTDFGIQAPRFRIVGIDLPLPDASGDYPELVLDFRQRQLRLPFYGTFTLPDGTDDPPQAVVSPHAPLWLTLCADGRIRLEGRVSLSMAGGAELAADLLFDDPNYNLQIAADGVNLPLIDTLAELLPDAPDSCLPEATGAAQLEQATRCLSSFAIVYQNFSAAAAAAMANADERDAPVAAPDASSVAGAVLRAWGYSALTPTAQVMPLDELQELLQQSGRAASASGDLCSAATHYAALQRAQLAVADGTLSGSGDAELLLVDAVAEARKAVRLRLLDAEALNSAEGVVATLRLLLEIESVNQSLGESSGDLLAELTALMERFLAGHLHSIGVVDDAFEPNLQIAAMNRFVAFETLNTLVNLLADAALLGADDALSNLPVDEALGQLGVRLTELTTAAVDTAESADDVPAFVFALEDYVEILAMRERVLFPDLQALPSVADINAYGARLDAVMAVDAARPDRDRSLMSHAGDARRLLRIIDEMPAEVAFAAPPFQRAYDRMDAALAVATAQLPALTNTNDLLIMLEAGTLQARLGGRFDLTLSSDWAGDGLPAVVERLVEVAESERCWGQIQAAVRLLINEADRLALADDQTRRHQYLEQTGVLLVSARIIAVDMWEDESARRSVDPLLAVADLLLPGGISVNNAVGAVQYDRIEQSVAGSFGGEIELPNCGASLTIANASFTSAGTFDLNAYGELQLPPEAPVVTVIVPASRPLHAGYDGTGFSLAGRTRVEFGDGIFFDATLQFEDPFYALRLETGGVELDLLEAIGEDLPQLPEFESMSDDDLAEWAAFYDVFGRLGGHALDDPTVAEFATGEQAKFEETVPAGLPDGVEAASLRLTLDAENSPAQLISEPADVQAIVELLILMTENLTGALQHNERLYEALFDDSVPDGAAQALEATVEVVQFDFEDGAFGTYETIQGPADALGVLKSSDRKWNVGGEDAIGLYSADGSFVDNLEIDFGRSDSGDGVIHWELEPSGFFMSSTSFFINHVDDFLVTELMADGVWASADVSLTDDLLGVSLTGLEAGQYLVLPIVRDVDIAQSSYRIAIGTAPVQGNQNTEITGHRFRINAIEDEPHQNWKHGENYVAGVVEMTNSAESMIVTVQPLAAAFEQRARLNGLQIVRAKPLIKRFQATSQSITLGESTTLEWETFLATSQRIDSGVGRVKSKGRRTVTPVVTTHYFLLARNANGTASSVLTVEVDGTTAKVRSVAQGLALVASIQVQAARALSGIQLSDAQRKRLEGLYDAQEAVLDQLTGRADAFKDEETVTAIVNVGLDVFTARGLTGSEGGGDVQGKVQQFMDNASDSFEKDNGIKANGDVDAGVIAAKTRQQSITIIQQSLKYATSGTLLNSDRAPDEAFIVAHYANATTLLLSEIGYNGQAPTVSLPGLSATEIRNLAGELRRVDGLAEVVVGAQPIPREAMSAMGTAMQDAIMKELETFPVADWFGRFLRVRDLSIGNAMRLANGDPVRLTSEIDTFTSDLAKQMLAASGATARLSREETSVLRGLPSTDPELASVIRQRSERALTGIEATLDDAWTAPQLKTGVPILNELVDIHLLLRSVTNTGHENTISAELLPPALIPRLRTRFTELAKARQDIAAFGRFSVALLSAAARARSDIGREEDSLVGTLRQSTYNLLQDSDEIAAEYSSRLAAAADSLPIDFTLPGALSIERVYGYMFYNRNTGLLGGGFGGSFELPEVNASFIVRDAEMANDGSFSLAVESSGPLPLGDVPMTASFSIAGDATGPVAINGEGELIIHGADPSGADDIVLAAAVEHDAEAQRFQFKTSAENLALCDFFAIFGADITLEFTPGITTMTVTGTVGLAANPGAAREGRSINDYQLQVIDAEVFLEIGTDGFEARIVSGTLVLPEFVTSLTLVDTAISSEGRFDLTAFGTMALPLSDPTVTMTIPSRRPLDIHFEAPNNLSFSAAVDVDLDNGLAFGGFMELANPVYCFGMYASGLELAMAREVIALRPTLPETDAFTEEVAGALNDYFRNLNGSLESLTALANIPDVQEPGPAPDFQPPAVTLEFEGVAGWINTVKANAVLGIDVSLADSLEPLQRLLRKLANGAKDTRLRLVAQAVDLRRFEAYQAATSDLAEVINANTGNASVQDVRDSAEFQAYLNGARENLTALMASAQLASLDDIRRVASIASQLAVAEGHLFDFDQDDTQNTALPALVVYLPVALDLFYETNGLAPLDSELLEGKTTADLITLFKDLQMLYDDVNLAGAEVDVTTYETANRDLALLLRQRAITDLQSTDAAQWERREKSIQLLSDLNDLAALGRWTWPDTVVQLDGTVAAFDVVADYEALLATAEDMARARLRDEGRQEADPLYALLRYAQNSGRALADDVRAAHADEISAVIAELNTLALEDWPQERLSDGIELLQSAIAAAAAAEQLGLTVDLATLGDVIIPNMTIEFTELAVAQKAWWLMNEYTRLLLEAAATEIGNDVTVLRSAYLRAATDTVEGLDRVAGAFGLLLPDLEAVGLALPGDLVVDEVFGSITYNPDTAFVTGTFGGNFRFPEIDARFAINEATLANDGSFTIDVTTAGPLPFGSVRMTADFIASGSPEGAVTFEGTGVLIIPGVDSEPDQVFTAEMAYYSAARTFAVGVGTQNLDFVVDPDFVVFDAAFLFELAPQSVTLTFDGAVGIAATGNASRALDPADYQFQLAIMDATTVLVLADDGFTASLDNGTLYLPDIFQTSLCPVNGVPGVLSGRAAVSLTPGNALTVAYAGAAIAFSGSIDFENIGFEVPELNGLAVGVCSATLIFDLETLPILSALNGVISIPLPDQSVSLEVIDLDWNLSGYPTGTIALRDDLRLFDAGGFALDLLVGSLDPAGVNTALTISANSFRFDGAVRFSCPADILVTDSGGELFAQANGSIVFVPGQLPQFKDIDLAIGGQDLDLLLRLGGEGGLLITNAALSLQGLDQMFGPTPEAPFTVAVSGGFEISEGLGFELDNAKFSFTGEPLPAFSIRGATLSAPDANGESTYNLFDGVPIQVTKAGFRFFDDSLALPELLAPTNIEITISASMSIPPGVGEGDAPIYGPVENLTVSLQDGVPHVTVDGVGLSINEFSVPPLTLTGSVFIGGLDEPENLYFVGQVGGTFSGAGVQALLAFDLKGPLGACLDVSAGSTGIPLAQSGFVITGAAGGVSFLNEFGDPCDFKSFVGHGDDPPARSIRDLPTGRMTWDDYDAYLERVEAEQLYAAEFAAGRIGAPTLPPLSPARAAGREDPCQTAARGALTYVAREEGEAALGIPCPTGDCPPATVNILCQPHPDTELYPNRIITKFSSLDTEFLDSIGLTQDFIETEIRDNPTEAAANLAQTVRCAVEQITPRPPDEGAGVDINAAIDAVLDELQGALQIILKPLIDGAIGEHATIYDAIVEAAYAGIECRDITIKLTGTLSHLSVSTFLSATGGFIVSSTGSAGVVGQVNLIGIPVGDLAGFVSITDENGNVNPSLCGQMKVALGPLELGQLAGLYECRDCVAGVLGAFGGLGTCLIDVSEDLVLDVLSKVAPETIDMLTADAALAALTDQQQLAFIAELFARPLDAAGVQCFLDSMVSPPDAIDPRLALCGSAQPKLFGLPLSPQKVTVSMAVDRTQMAGGFTFPVGSLLSYLGSLFPLGDATLGMSLGMPDLPELVGGAVEGNLTSTEFFDDAFDDMLTQATFTIGYEFSPFGLKGLRSTARVIMPDLTDHPAAPESDWILPVERDLPSRLELVLSANASGETPLLANPVWTGTEENLHLAFPENSVNRAAIEDYQSQNPDMPLTLVQDYFPHGGVIGAANLSFPKALVDAPPPSLGVLLGGPTDDYNACPDLDSDAFTRLCALGDFIANHVLVTSEVGSIAFYIPAPNPPDTLLQGAGGTELDPKAVLDAIMNFDLPPLEAGALYPIEVAFMQGYLDTRLLGIPIVEAEVVAIPPNGDTEGLFQATSRIPEGSWLEDFIDSTSLQFEIRQPPLLPIQERFLLLQTEVDSLIAANDPAAAAEFLTTVPDILFQDLPKVSLELDVNSLRIPAALSDIVTFEASGRMVAYSPCYEPGFFGDETMAFDGPMARARRNGGVAMQVHDVEAGFIFAGDPILIDNAELAITPSDDIALLPAISGLLDVPSLPIAPGITFTDVVVEFNSQPQVGEPYLAAESTLAPIDLGPFLQVTPLEPATELDAFLRVVNVGESLPETRLELAPARIQVPLFGDGFDAEIYGATDADRFSFSTDGEWAATVRIKGPIVMHAPQLTAGGLPVLDGDGLPVLEETPLLEIGTTDTVFIAQLRGVGLTQSTLDITLPPMIETVVLPADPDLEQSFNLGVPDAQAHLLVSRDGTFELTIDLDNPHQLIGFPIAQLDSAAMFRLNNNGVTVSGSISGGALDSTNPLEALGALTIGIDGSLTFAGSATLPPLQFGVMRLSGTVVNSVPSNLEVVLDNTGVRLPNGAQLAVQGVSNELFVIDDDSFIGNDGDFSIGVSGTLGFDGVFEYCDGSLSFERADDGVVTFDLMGGELVVMPGAFESRISLEERAFFSSDGRFYYNSGLQEDIGLPGLISATGRLEFGFEPDPRSPVFQAVPPTLVDFDEVDIGITVAQTVRVTNTGQSQLFMFAGIQGYNFSVSPNSGALGPGEFGDFTVRFRPHEPGDFEASLVFLHNGITSPNAITLQGQGRAVPIYYTSDDVVAFGESPVGGGGNRFVTIANIGHDTLEISSIATTAPFTVVPAVATLEPGDDIRLFITFRPVADGVFEEALTLTTNDDAGSHTIDLSGTGTDVRWYRQRPFGDNINAIQMRDGDNGWAVGEDGTLLKTRDGGRSWSALDEFTSRHLNDVVFTSDNNGLIVGDAGNAFETTDGGSTWTAVADDLVDDPGFSINGAAQSHHNSVSGFIAIHIVGENQSGLGQVAWKSENTWQTAFLEEGTPALNDVAFVFNDDGVSRGIAAGRDRTITRSTNGGFSWINVTLPGEVPAGLIFYGVAYDDTNVLVVGQGGVILRSGNDGGTWEMLSAVPTQQNLYSVTLSGDRAWATGESGTVLRSDDAGLTWINESLQVGTSLYAVEDSGGAVWTGGRLGEIHHRPVNPPAHPLLTMETGRIDFESHAVGAQVFRQITLYNAGPDTLDLSSISISGDPVFTVQPTSFANLEPGVATLLRVFYSPAVFGDHTATVEIVADGDPDGPFEIDLLGRGVVNEVWIGSLTSTDDAFIDLQFVDSDVAYAATTGDVYKTVDGGVTWTALEASPPGPLRKILFLDADTGFAVGGGGNNAVGCGDDPNCMSTSITTTDGGATWTAMTTGVLNIIVDIAASPSGSLFAVTASYLSGNSTVQGQVIRSANQTSWSQPNHGLTTFDGGAIQALNNGIVYVSSGGTLYRSAAAGDDMVAVDNYGGDQPISRILFSDDNHGWLIGYGGLYRYTTNGGTTSGDWNAVAAFTPGRMDDIHFADADNGWIAGQGDASVNLDPAIFHTTDGGLTWEDRYPGREGHPRVVDGLSATVAHAAGLNGEFFSYRTVELLPRPAAAIPVEVALGSVAVGDTNEFTVTLQNIGDEPLHIQDISIDSESDAFALNNQSIVYGELPVQGLAVDGYGTANWSADGTGPEAAGIGHELPFAPGFFAFYYLASRDHIEPESPGAYHGIGTISGYPLFNAALASAGYTSEDITYQYSPTSLGDDVLGEDWTWDGVSVETRYYRGGNFQLLLDGIPMVGGPSPDLFVHIDYHNLVTTADDEIIGESGFVMPVGIAPDDRPDIAIIANAFIEDTAETGFRIVFGGLQAAPLVEGVTEISEDGRSGIYSETLAADLQGGIVDIIEEPLPDTLAPGASLEIPVRFKTDVAGGFEAVLSVVSDGVVAVTTTTLRATADTLPHVTIIDTQPSGISIEIDEASYTTPVAFTVRSDPRDGEWAPGETHTITAMAESEHGGATYHFQAWSPAAERSFTYTVDARTSHLIARHVEVLPVTAARSAYTPWAQRLAGAAHVDEGLPEDIPPGPWIRVSGVDAGSPATLDLPALGNLNLQGSLFLSSERMNGSLASSELRIPEAVGLPELFYVSAGSWSFEYKKNSHLRLTAETPGVDIFELPLTPSSEVVLEFLATGDFTISIATDDDLLLLPGIVEFDPGAIQLAKQGVEFSLDINGELRMLRRPDRTYVYQQVVDFHTETGTFTYVLDDDDLPGSLLSNDLVDLGTNSLSTVILSRDDAGVFGVAVNNLELVLLAQTFTGMSGSVEGSLLSLSASPPGSPFKVGPFELAVDGDSTLAWDVLAGDLQVSIASSTITAPDVSGWPDEGLAFPGFAFDSGGEFDHTIVLPELALGTLTFAPGGDEDENFVRFRRHNSVLSLQIHDERDFFLGTGVADLKVDSAGAVSGRLSGEFGVNLGLLGDVDFGSTTMIYNSAAPYQFTGRSDVSFLGGFDLSYGGAGGKVCQLSCEDGDTLDECDIWSCFPSFPYP